MLKILSLCALLLFSSSLQASTDITINHSLSLESQEFHENSDRQHYGIDLSYPQISGERLNEACRGFNQSIQEIIAQEVDAFKSGTLKSDAEMTKVRGGEDTESSLQIRYDAQVIWPHSQPIISVILTIDRHLNDKTYPRVYHHSLNYDLQNGKVLGLYDLFRSDGAFTDKAADYIANELSSSTGMTRREIKKSYLPFNTWTLGPNDITFVFDDFPRVLGTQTVVIPYFTLRTVMLDNSPLVSCWDEESDCSKWAPQPVALKGKKKGPLTKALAKRDNKARLCLLTPQKTPLSKKLPPQ